MPPDIPDIVIGRLPIYLRELTLLSQEGYEVTSSHELGERLGISSAQIRKDLSWFGRYFGPFGKQGTGYNIPYLLEQLRKILQLDHDWPVALVGAGDLGRALARYGGFSHRGFRITMIFDNDQAKIGSYVGNIRVLSTADLQAELQNSGIQIAMVAVPSSAAQAVTDQLVKSGIRAILNYAPIVLSVPEGVRVQHIDPAAHLQHMTYYLR
ncbi:MAG: redox-sensing transcriptional repressor Rex [Anaerolineae bacterium]|nr:redox-sensing transcriptional repressor Rex [Anaerolineae bacterium]